MVSPCNYPEVCRLGRYDFLMPRSNASIFGVRWVVARISPDCPADRNIWRQFHRSGSCCEQQRACSGQAMTLRAKHGARPGISLQFQIPSATRPLQTTIKLTMITARKLDEARSWRMTAPSNISSGRTLTPQNFETHDARIAAHKSG